MYLSKTDFYCGGVGWETAHMQRLEKNVMEWAMSSTFTWVPGIELESDLQQAPSTTESSPQNLGNLI